MRSAFVAYLGWLGSRVGYQSLFALVLLGACSVGMGQTLSVEPSVVDAGDEATLAWNSESPNVFITGFGQLAGSGRIRVQPTRTTTYSMPLS